MIRCYYTLNEITIDTGEYSWSNRLLTEWALPPFSQESDERKELFKNCIDRFGPENVVYIDLCGDVRPTVEEIKANPELKELVREQVRKIARFISNSSFRYEKLIQLYKNHENDLMKRIESTVQFNDTPQSTTEGLDGDQYASTYTKNATDGATVMARLSEIRALWTNLYDDWADEFAKKFVL